MGKAVAIHSHKGGTGKTMIAANLASLFAQSGKNACLLDYDFRAPSQYVLFKEKPKHWLNDYLDGRCAISDAIVDFTEKFHTTGKLLVGFANPDSETVLDMITKDRGWQSKALRRIMEARDELYGNFKIDYLLFDTTPGLHFSAVDAVATSDMAILVMRPDLLDFEGTKILIKAIYQVLEKKTFILINKLITKLWCQTPGANIELLDEKSVIEKFNVNLPVIGTIPCYCDLMFTGGESIPVFDQPNHPFVSKLKLITQRIEERGS